MSERLEKVLIGLSIAAVIVLVLIMTVPFGERSEPNIWPCSHTASSMCPSNMITGRVYSEVVNFGWLAFLLAVEWLVLTELCFFAGRGVDKLSAVGFGLTGTLIALLLAFFIRDVYFSFGEFVNTLLGWTGFIVWMCVFVLGGLALFEGWCWFERKNEEWFKWLKAEQLRCGEVSEMDLAKGMFFMSDCYDYGPTLLVWNEAAYGEVDLTVAGAIINDPYLIPSSIYRYVRVGDGDGDWLVPYIKDKWPDVISVHPLEEGISHLHYELKEPFFVEVDFSAIKGKVGTLVFEEGR